MNTAIEALKLSPVEHQGNRVITLGMMDEVHERPEGTAKRAFREHRDKLIEGRHYFSVAAGELRTGNVPKPGNPSTLQPLLTERGYLMLVKTFRDALAWRIQEELIEGYFRARDLSRSSFEEAVLRRLDAIESNQWNFQHGFNAQVLRRFDALESATANRIAELEVGLKRIRAGARVLATGRRGGTERKPRHRAPKPLVSSALLPFLAGMGR